MGQRQQQYQQIRGAIAACLATQAVLLVALVAPAPILAQALPPEIRDTFLADPLQDTPRDHLLPDPPVARPLSPLEKVQLDADLNDLDQRASALWADRQAEAAIELWMREVRLRRILGLDTELATIQRVGQRVWEAGQTQEIQLLTLRLRQIQAQLATPDPTNLEHWESLATVFEILGEPVDAIAAYQQLAAVAQANGEGDRYLTYLEQIGGLQTAWFFFPDAAMTYQQLAQLALARTDPAASIPYLRQAITSHEQAQQFQAAAVTQQNLLNIYETLGLQSFIPQLQQQIADNYRILGEIEAASEYYQVAYTGAILLKQFAVAHQSVQSLIDLYRAQDRWPEVIYLYEQLILVDQKSYNAYGIMATFAQLGLLYEDLEEPEQALMAFREGLVLARHLNYQEAFFLERIEQLSPNDPTLPDGDWRDADTASPPESAPLEPSLPLE